MLRLHLPRGDVRFICLRLTVRFFSWIEGGYGLLRVCLHFIRQSCDFFHWLPTDRRKAVERTCGERAIIVRSSQHYREIARISYDARAASSRRSQGDLTVAVRQPYDSLTGVVRLSLDLTVIVRFRFKWPYQILRSPHDRPKATVWPLGGSRAAIVWCSYDVSSGYDLTFFIFCIIPS